MMRLIFQGLGVPTLDAVALAQAIDGATVRELTVSQSGGYEVDIQLERPSHQEALDDIYNFLLPLGFTVADAVVTEWVNATVQVALIGALGGGAAGSTSRNAGTALAGTLLGGIAGGIAGSFVRNMRATYSAQRLYPSGWQLTHIPQPGGSAATA